MNFTGFSNDEIAGVIDAILVRKADFQYHRDDTASTGPTDDSRATDQECDVRDCRMDLSHGGQGRHLVVFSCSGD
jgi:hypothetical protein